MDFEKNRDVRLNYGMICRGSLRDIEALQRLIDESRLVVAYHTVTDKRLKLVKVNGDNNLGKNTKTN